LLCRPREATSNVLRSIESRMRYEAPNHLKTIKAHSSHAIHARVSTQSCGQPWRRWYTIPACTSMAATSSLLTAFYQIICMPSKYNYWYTGGKNDQWIFLNATFYVDDLITADSIKQKWAIGTTPLNNKHNNWQHSCKFTAVVRIQRY
jgi:hypothetical protein